jgi:hypothetical protein
MIINSVCSTCFQPYKLLIQASDVELVKQLSHTEGRSCPCPRLCGGSINLVGQPDITGTKLRDPIEITGLQLFQAVNGMGLPDEIPKDAVVIDALLRGNRVTSIDMQEFNGSFYLNELRLEGGVTIHLSAGGRGARVLKITKEKS